MSRKLYIFNRETASFEEHKPSFGRQVASVARYLAGGLAVALLIYALSALVISNGRERALKAENDYLKEHYDNLISRSRLVDDVLASLQQRDKAIYNNIFDADPPSVEAILGDIPQEALEEYYAASEEQLVGDANSRLQALAASAANVDRAIRAIDSRLQDEDFNKNNFPSVIPLRNFTIAQTGATVGRKVNPFYKSIADHNGIDLMAPYGTEVLAAADGKVVEVLRQGKGLGNMVIIDHGDGLRTLYAHLSDIYVAMNQKVARGKVIGKVGSSGATFTASLHYEVRKNGRAVDPVNYFFASASPAAYSEMLLIANTTGQSLD